MAEGAAVAVDRSGRQLILDPVALDAAIAAARMPARDQRAGVAGPGLVSSQTSDKHLDSCGFSGPLPAWFTGDPFKLRDLHRQVSRAVVPGSGDVVVDPVQSRLKRMRSGVLTAARLIQDRLGTSGRRWKAAMLHLTYRDEAEFDTSKVSALMKHIREWARRRGLPPLPYVWVLERGERRGRLHYHVLIWLPAGITLPKPDKQGWWPWGYTKWQWARHPVGYLAKYASKGSGGGRGFFPQGTRIHGRGGLTVVERSKCAWWRAPAWVKQAWPRWEDQPRPAPGGGWVSRVLGDWLPSPWSFLGLDSDGHPVIRWVADYPNPHALESV